jgi:hypothetical protein
MKSFIQKHEKDVMGTLSGFDRLVFRGTLRGLSFAEGMSMYLSFAGVLLKDFAKHVLDVTIRIKAASLALAERSLRPIKYLHSSQVHKEDIAREIAATDNVSQGLICVLTCVEPCQSFEIYRNREAKMLELQRRFRKCLHIYHYFFHPQFGFMSANGLEIFKNLTLRGSIENIWEPQADALRAWHKNRSCSDVLVQPERV